MVEINVVDLNEVYNVHKTDIFCDAVTFLTKVYFISTLVF